MKRTFTLAAAMALTLSACPLFAQETQPPSQPRPPQPPPREGEPHREGHRPAPGLFGALDANHDGAIDQTELGKAMDILRSLDRNGDGRIMADEMQPQGGRENRGPREPGAQTEGRRDENARGEGRREEPRREGARPDGDRAPRPEGESRRESDHPRSDSPERPRVDGPRDGQRSPGGPQEQRDRGEKREGPQGPPPGYAPQAQSREHFRDMWMKRAQERFAQHARPDFGRGGQRPPWATGDFRQGGNQSGPMAMGPRMDHRQGPDRMQGRGDFAPRELHRDHGTRGPQGEPGPMQRPHFDGPPRPDMNQPRRPDGHGERGAREDQRPRDVQ